MARSTRFFLPTSTILDDDALIGAGGIPHRRWLFLVLLAIPLMIAASSGTIGQNGGWMFVLAGMASLLPAVVVLIREGWRGGFSATAIVSLFAYLLYNNAMLIYGDALLPLSDLEYPDIGTAVRDEAAEVNLLGCVALSAGLLLTYRRVKPVRAEEKIGVGRLFVPDATLRSAVIAILVAFVGTRLYLIHQSGQSVIDFMLGGRSSGSFEELSGGSDHLVRLSGVFQATGMIAGALLLARRSKLKFARLIALLGIAIPLVERMLRGGRGQFIGYILALVGMAITMPLPLVHARVRRALPLVGILMVVAFAAMSVFREGGFGGVAEEGSGALTKGLETLLTYDQFTALEQVMYLIPDRYDPVGGESLIALPANPVPRAWWPGKPEDLGTMLPTMLGKQGDLTMSAGLIGEGWFNFMLPGALLLPFCFGLFTGWWDRLRNLGSAWPDVYALWASAVAGLFFMVRGSFLFGGTLVGYTVAGTAILLLVYGRVLKSGVDPDDFRRGVSPTLLSRRSGANVSGGS